ncbi:hypothetical protein H2200_006923 [Cladophialophora chaetospira]|uniref:Uncharacterized protein n=1 Tax=Cladophialophora chaetospira TaxID=386627 RepID=A0AA38X950_9EURO|nr:hypothetical protein H2200_006923 [Cladophialophora chaetospira]
MVKFRGIEVNVISQFDICKLPEFAATTSNHPDPYPAGPHPSYPTATCAVPIYPGSQIWFEYTVDGPHPTGAIYFFKLIINGVVVTSWDCTAKLGFHGKMMYNLVSESRGQVSRQALRFGDGMGEGHSEDVVQVNVYRVEKRVRIKNIEEGIGKVAIKTAKADGLRLTNSGLLEPGIRPKRYKYQLLDPVDMPYAAFKFHCRSIEYLETHSVAPLRDCNSPPSARSSMDTQSSGNVQLIPTPTQSTTQGQYDQDPNLGSSPSKNTTNTSPAKAATGNKSAEQKDATTIKTSQSLSRIHLSGSDDSLSVKARDSLEDLPSSVTRSPRSPKSPKSSKRDTVSEIPPSPTRSPQSSRQTLVKKLTITTNEGGLDEEGKKGALSPFTRGGLLRKASLPPRTAPASVTEFGPTVEEEVMAKMHEEKQEMEANAQKSALRTTAEERGGKKLIGFLSRRFAIEKGAGSNASAASKCMAGRDNR